MRSLRFADLPILVKLAFAPAFAVIVLALVSGGAFYSEQQQAKTLDHVVEHDMIVSTKLSGVTKRITAAHLEIYELLTQEARAGAAPPDQADKVKQLLANVDGIKKDLDTLRPEIPADQLPIAIAKCNTGKSTTDCSNLIIGGKNLAVASAEYEYYFTPNWGIGTFVDAGDAFSAFGDYKTHIGTGFGLRWRSPVGMVRADLGFPVNDPEGRHGVQQHLIIGPDL